MKICYTTLPDLESARKLARTLISEKWAACVNISPGTYSIYEWDGKIQEENEIYLYIKTTEARISGLMKRVEECHPYEVPCILSWDVEKGHPPFADWVNKQVSC